MAQPTRPAPGCAHVHAHAHSANPAAPARPTCAEIERASRCRSALGRGGGTVGRLSVLSRQNRYGWQLCSCLPIIHVFPLPQSHILLFRFSFMPHFFQYCAPAFHEFMYTCTVFQFHHSALILFSATNCSYCHSAIHQYPHSPILQLADLCFHCTEYFSQGTAGKQEECFLSEASEAYAFGSNSSSQLAMGTQEKVLQATHMPHMANCQVVSV